VVKFIKEWIIPLIIAFIIAAAINAFVIFKIRVPSESMVPTLMVKEQFFALRVHSFTKLRLGDIIVFKSDELNEVMVKRLIGLPGDKVDVKSGRIYINGVKYNDSFVKNRDDYTGSFKVPAGKYFFMGDNRPVSFDSRFWKEHYIPRNKIMGKVFIRVYPFNKIKLIK
jgi:signal peptidase I